MGKNTNLNTGAPKHNKLTCKIIESDDFINLHLFYELRMLLGAAKMIKLFDENDMGNPSNYFRDSVYLHARNLYNFFDGEATYDSSIHTYVNYVFDVSLYIKFKSQLHAKVLHIGEPRVEEVGIPDTCN